MAEELSRGLIGEIIPVQKNNGCQQNKDGRCNVANDAPRPTFTDKEGYCHVDTTGAPSCKRFTPLKRITRRPK